jgi:hypothetical protein
MNVVECTIPPHMTIERWPRLRRSTAPTQRDPWSRLLAATRRVARHGERRCDHLHDTVSRYDHAAKRLELFVAHMPGLRDRESDSQPRVRAQVRTVRGMRPRTPPARGRGRGRARPRSVGGTAGLRGCAVIERRDGACELPIAADEIPIDRTAHGAMSCSSHQQRTERLLMETHPGATRGTAILRAAGDAPKPSTTANDPGW